jgi:hypothetical protein
MPLKKCTHYYFSCFKCKRSFSNVQSFGSHKCEIGLRPGPPNYFTYFCNRSSKSPPGKGYCR